jgi:small subunit ribosomal protein S3
MTHHVHPYGHRLGILRDWKSRWFGVGGKYAANLKADVLLREYLKKKLKGFYVGSIDVERNEKAIRLIISTSRPGLLIGRSGEGATKLRNDIASFMTKNGFAGSELLKIDIEEIRAPEANASVVAQMIVESLEKRMTFRRVLKQTAEKVMANRDVQGVKINLAGRLGGGEMARREQIKKGRIPLQTLRSDIDFARERAVLPYGDIGIKVWIYKGEVFSK